MFNNLVYWVLFSLIVAGCAGDPVRVQFPPNHPADHRTQEPEFWTIPNPFARMPEEASIGSATGEPDESKPESDSLDHHGHPASGSNHSMPHGHESTGGDEHSHPMEHAQ